MCIISCYVSLLSFTDEDSRSLHIKRSRKEDPKKRSCVDNTGHFVVTRKMGSGLNKKSAAGRGKALATGKTPASGSRRSKPPPEYSEEDEAASADEESDDERMISS